MSGDSASGPLSRSRERARVRARTLRESPTDAESLLWYHLRDRRLAGFKFRRQRPIGPYFADFACLEARLVVELDGGQHVDEAGYDERRTALMNAEGFHVLRFWNNEVLAQTEAVLEVILRALQEGADPHPNPLPLAGEGARHQEQIQ
ncbi:endonuclease domain-containing protein [Variovorax robiniae]|uniref:Endonuclease domain-containing protein n=1 Tax=Variovorax robiniae TaxID=1836199 RepID=A0ABU8X4Q6_9BURK